MVKTAIARQRAGTDAPAPKLLEDVMDDFVYELCTLLRPRGVGGYHIPDSRRATIAGFPDWVIWGPGGVMFRENKTDTGRVSAAQRRVIMELATGGADVKVWYEADRKSGLIEAEIKAIAKPRPGGPVVLDLELLFGKPGAKPVKVQPARLKCGCPLGTIQHRCPTWGGSK